MSVSRYKSLSLLMGIGAAGCMPHMGGTPSAQGVAQPPLAAKAEPLIARESDAERQRVVVDSVNDTVDRVSRIIAQRSQADQAAKDIRELRESREVAAAAQASQKPVDESTTIERLAAAIRQGKSIDPIPKPAPVAVAPPAESGAPAQLSAAGPLGDDVDYGDQRPTGMAVAPFVSGPPASGTMLTPTQVQVERPEPRVGGVLRRTGGAASVEPLIAAGEKFASRVAEDPRDLGAQLDLQLLRFLKAEPVPAMADLSALQSEDRELLAALCDAMSNFRSLVHTDPNPLGSEKARPFIEMADRIRSRSDLTVTSLNLCDAVQAFGNYEPIAPLQFTAGTPRKSVLYCEVDGFLAQLNDKQLWETRLSLELRLYDERSMMVWNLPAEPVVDVSRKRRRDFFIAKLIQLPSNLRAGHYFLKANVKDTQANRVNESTIQFDVVPKGS